MEKVRSCAIFTLLQFLVGLRLGGCNFVCFTDCFGPYQSLWPPITSCDVVNDVLSCYYANQFACDQDPRLFFSLGLAIQDHSSLGCPPIPNTATVTATDPEPPPPDISCPSLPEVYDTNPSIAMSRADIFPHFHRPSCSASPVTSLKQCGLFMDSHLRAFTSYRGGLETCSIPGSWFLLHHEDISIEVEGTNLEPNSSHTRLTKVNITVHSHECNPSARTYLAYNTQPLPSDFTPPQSTNEEETSPLQLKLGADRSVATLMVTWLNITIIIRQYASLLSITLQVPRELSLESEGLCTGCPSHMYVNITAFNSLLPSLCSDDNERALQNCFSHAGIVNQNELIHVNNNSYFDACVFSMHKIKTPEVLSMFNAIADDAKLLVNVGTEPGPPPITFPIQSFPPEVSQSTMTQSTMTQSTMTQSTMTTPIATVTTEISSASSHSSTFTLMSLFIFLCSLVV